MTQFSVTWRATMTEPDGEKIVWFYILYITGTCNLQYRLRYLEAPNQAHIKVKNVFPDKKHLILTMKVTQSKP